MFLLFINIHFILGSTENSIPPETTVEENDAQISTSVQEKMIQSCDLQVNQNVSKDFKQSQLSQRSHAFHTEELVVEQGDHWEKGDLDTFEDELKVAEENKLIDLEKLPHDGNVQKIEVLERETETSEDTQEPNHKEKVTMNDIPLTCPHPLNEEAAPVYGPEEDTEHLDLFCLPLLSSMYTDDLPDLNDAEFMVAFPTRQSSKQKRLLHSEDGETH